jgi:hypothetical protein
MIKIIFILSNYISKLYQIIALYILLENNLVFCELFFSGVIYLFSNQAEADTIRE